MGQSPLDCGIWHLLQGDSVRIDLDCRTSIWERIGDLLGVKKAPHILGVRGVV